MKSQFEDIHGHLHMLTKQIGEPGGQGVVYRTADPNLAVKLLHNSNRTDVCTDTSGNKRYEELRLFPIPDHTNLTLPLAELKDAAGYVMMLLDDMEEFGDAFTPEENHNEINNNPWVKEMCGINPDFGEFIGDYLSTGGRRRRLSAYLGAARVLSALHARGLVYCDFSGKNCFISTVPGNDTVWLIDADNLSFAESITKDAVCTHEFAAPEVIRNGIFTPWSDCYSFAVALFKDLMAVHPFMGALQAQSFEEDDFADDAEERAYSGEFPWILDQDDKSNYGDGDYGIIAEDRKRILTDRLFHLFDRTFSEMGRKKRKTRPTMFEWAFALAADIDTSIKCPYCQMDYDYTHDICPWCDTKPRILSLISRKENRVLWNYVHEIEEEIELQLPNRLISGFKMSQREGMAFSACKKGGQLHLSDLNIGYTWSVSTDGGSSYRDIFGQPTVPLVCTIRSINTTTGEVIITEVNCE